MSTAQRPTWNDVADTWSKELVRNPFRAVILAVLVAYYVSTGEFSQQDQLLLAAFFGSIASKWFDLVSDVLYLVWQKLLDETVRRLPSQHIDDVETGVFVVFPFIGIVFSFLIIERSGLVLGGVLVVVFVLMLFSRIYAVAS